MLYVIIVIYVFNQIKFFLVLTVLNKILITFKQLYRYADALHCLTLEKST